MKIIKNWILPITVALGLFLLIRPVMAQSVAVSDNISVGTTADEEGFSQIYYKSGENQVIITNTRYTNGSPATDGKYIAWAGQVNGAWQIFLYDVATGVTTQITYTGNNVNPKVDKDGRVIWEGWDGETWQVFFFDGISTQQLTVGDTAINPEFGGDYISYGRRNSAGTWRAVVYSMIDKKSVDVTTGEETRKPKISKNGEIYFGTNQEKFPLKVDDLFLLDLVSVSESTFSADPILEELSATPSGVVEIESRI